MAKRTASSELNQDNWNDKEEKEVAGTFKSLAGSELQNRVIRKAKRTLTNSANSEGKQSAASSPFAMFSGFSTAAASEGSQSAASSPFAKFSGFSTAAASSPFLAANKTDSPVSTASSTAEKTPAATNSPFSFLLNKNKNSTPSTFFGSKSLDSKTPNGNPEEAQTSKNSAPSSVGTNEPKQGRSVEYYKQLKSLNDSVLKWMQLHLEKNACSDFTPVFNDYKKHLDTINVTYPVQKKEGVAVQESKDPHVFKRPSMDDQTNVKVEHKKQRQDETDYGAHFNSNTTNTSTFSFGSKLAHCATSSNSPLGPASSSKEDKQNCSEEKETVTQFGAGFFGKAMQSNASKPFSFATAPVEKTADAAEGEEYVPPKNDFVAVSEEDALYSKRCKLFFKKGDAFAEKGVGTLYLKSLEEKTQLLVRADTNLGNILLNIMLSDKLPISRTGKNNVLIVCVPNPPVDAKNPNSKEAIPLLIRVKTAQEADEMLEVLNKYKS